MLKRTLAATLGSRSRCHAAAAGGSRVRLAHLVGSAGVNNFVYGTQSYVSYKVWADVVTESPAETEVSFNLEPTNPDCYMYEYGDLRRESGGRFSGTVLITQGDITSNACAGDWVLSISAFDWSAEGGYVSGDERIVRFKRHSRIDNHNASPEPIRSGDTVRVAADLRRASWNDWRYGGVGGRPVELQFKPSGGSYSTIKTVTSDSVGHVSTSTGQYRDGATAGCSAGSPRPPRPPVAGTASTCFDERCPQRLRRRGAECQRLGLPAVT